MEKIINALIYILTTNERVLKYLRWKREKYCEWCHGSGWYYPTDQNGKRRCIDGVHDY
jgi:hypothetical protein